MNSQVVKTINLWLILAKQANQKSDFNVKFITLLYFSYIHVYNKQLSDEVSVISRIIKVEIMVISESRRLRLITLTETLIILDITKTESNNNFVLLYIERKKLKSCFCFFTDCKQHKACELDMITLGNHAPWSYMTSLAMTLSVLDIIIV